MAGTVVTTASVGAGRDAGASPAVRALRVMRGSRMSRVSTWALAAALTVVVDSGWAADPAPAPVPTAAPSRKERPATLEAIPGSALKRIVLSAKAAERAGIEQGNVGEQPVPATLMFGAMIVDAASVGGDARKDAKALALRIGLSPAESARLDRTKPARILALATRPALAREVIALPMQQPVAEATKSGMVALYYSIPADVAGVTLGSRVRAELQLEGSGEARKTVPNSAIYYDANGDAWVYVVATPLAYVRERVDVERVAGNLAVLAKGPVAGTAVVTVGVSLLHGVEIFGK